jgi:hypothetical protein
MTGYYPSEYRRLEAELRDEAEQLYEPWRADCREVTAVVLEIRSELMRNGVEHTSDNLVELAKLVLGRRR